MRDDKSLQMTIWIWLNRSRLPACRLLIGIMLLLGTGYTQTSQLQLQTIIQPYPSPYISDWQTQPGIVMVELSSNAPQEYEIVLQARISGSRYGQVAEGRSMPIRIPAGEQFLTIHSPDMVDWGSVSYNHVLESQIIQTGRIPEDEYELCITALHFPDDIPLAEDCQPFTVLLPEPPSLILPEDGASLSEATPLFQWTAAQWIPGKPLQFLLRIVPQQPGQTPQEALFGNAPQLEISLANLDFLVYPPDALPLEEAQWYVWQVQALDEAGYPVGENDGRSEIWRFRYLGAPAGGEAGAGVCVVCRWGDDLFLLPEDVCLALGGDPDGRIPGLKASSGDTLPAAVPGLDWKNSLPGLLSEAPHSLEIRSTVAADTLAAAIFAYRRLRDSTWQAISGDEDGSDGWRARWTVDGLSPGFYEVMARAVNRQNQTYEIVQVTARPPLVNIPFNVFPPPGGGMPAPVNQQQAAALEAQIQQNWNGAALQLQQEQSKKLSKRDSLLQARQQHAQEQQKAAKLAAELATIDSLLEAVPNTFIPKIRELQEKLRKIASPPNPADIQKAVDDAQARADACKKKLDQLKKEQADLEKQRDDLKQQQDDLLQQLDQLHHDNGYTGGSGYHSNGKYHWGYVTLGPSIGYGTTAYTQYKNITGQLKKLNGQYQDALDKLKDLPDKIKEAEKECAELEAALKAAKAVKSKQDLAKKEMAECARQIHDLLKKLADWCRAHPGQCAFQDLLDQLMTESPATPEDWEQFWKHFRELLRQKQALEQALKQKARDAGNKVKKTDQEIKNAEDAERREKEEEERKKKLFGDGAALPEEQELSEEQLVAGLTFLFKQKQGDALGNPNTCENKCLLALEDILGNNYVELVRGVANAAFKGGANALVSMLGLNFVAGLVAKTATGMLIDCLNNPDLVTFGALENYHYTYKGTKRGVPVDIDCHISAALFYNPKTGYVRGIIRCNCCGQEKLLFVKYKAKANGMPEKGTGTFHWIK